MYKKTLLWFLIIVIGSAACNKKDYQSSTLTNTNTNTGSLATVFATAAVTPKIVSIDATTGGSFYGTGGVRNVFPPNGFQTATGASVTGMVQVQVADYIKRSDMIFSGIAPISNAQPLISGGEVYLNATQGGQTLYMKPGNRCQINLPQKHTPPSGMQLFYADGAFKKTTGGVNWRLAHVDSAGGSVVYNGDTLSLNTDSLKMCNADQFMSSPDYQTFTVTLNAGGATISDSLVMAFALCDNFNGYWPMVGEYGGGVTNHVISVDHVPDIPVHFVAVAIINGWLYAGILGATPSNGTNYTITLKPTTIADLKTAIDAL